MSIFTIKNQIFLFYQYIYLYIYILFILLNGIVKLTL